MRKAIAILILSLFLTSTTDLYQLLKLPLLVDHYIQHKSLDENITVWQFLCIHYAHGDVKDADYAQDMKLPFKTSDKYNSSNLVAIPTSAISYTLNIPLTKTPLSGIYYLPVKLPSFLPSIWQPPKFS